MNIFGNSNRKKNIRARDGHERMTSAERRAIRKISGNSGRIQKRLIKERRAEKYGNHNHKYL